jgi:hypothetical protein
VWRQYNALGHRIEARYDLSGNGKLTDEDDLCERYVYDSSWRLISIYRSLKGFSVFTPGVGPAADVLYQRLVYHQGGLGGRSTATGVGDQLLMRQRVLPRPMVDGEGVPIEGQWSFPVETEYYLQDRHGSVVALVQEEPKYALGDGSPWSRSVVERVKYSPFGAPTCFPAADINLDGQVNDDDVAAWKRISNEVSNTSPDQLILRRADLNLDGVVDQFDEVYHVRDRVYDPLLSGVGR